MTKAFTFTVPEVRNLDFTYRRASIDQLTVRLDNRCRKQGIGFFLGASDSAIRSMRSSKAIDFVFTDLISNREHYQSINDICKKQGKHLYVVTDNIVDDYNLECVTFFSLPHLLGIISMPEPISIRPPTKLFNCLIQRSCPIRQSWFYFLYNNNLLDQGYVSYLLKNIAFRTELLGREQFDWFHYNHKLDQLPQFDQAYHALKTLVPYRNFDNHADVGQFLADSKYSLILESYAVDDDRGAWLFSEKTIRALQIPTYPLIFAQRNGIAKLKNLGLEVAVDHSTFDHLDWIQRQQAILKILVNDEIEYNEELLTHVSQHNYSLIKSWHTEIHRDDFFDQVFDQIC